MLFAGTLAKIWASRRGTRSTRRKITPFAELTGDKYWIHVDPARAAIETPFGSTIAHGLLTLSLGPRLSDEIYTITAVPMCLNYGFGKVRFTAPVPVGSRVRMRAKLELIARVLEA